MEFSRKSLFFLTLESLIFGALIIAIVQTLREILNYLDKKFKKYTKSNSIMNSILNSIMNNSLNAIICCCKCCLWCLEKCLKYINKNAYIICGIYGWNFCKSACHAFGLIITNIARFGAVGMITNIIIKWRVSQIQLVSKKMSHFSKR